MAPVRSALDAAFRNRQIMKADLRHAVEAGNLRVVYQPIVAMGSMRITSCEALCRWDHPDLGPISPSVFIPLAEEMGIITEISTFMLNLPATNAQDGRNTRAFPSTCQQKTSEALTSSANWQRAFRLRPCRRPARDRGDGDGTAR